MMRPDRRCCLLLAVRRLQPDRPVSARGHLAAERRQRGQSARHGGGARRSGCRRRRAGPADGDLAAAALNRLRHDQVRPLPDSGLAQIVPVGSGSTARRRGCAAAAPGSGN